MPQIKKPVANQPERHNKRPDESSCLEDLSIPAGIQRVLAAQDMPAFNRAFTDAADAISNFSHYVIIRAFPAMQSSDREVAVQETLVTVWRLLDSIDPKQNVMAWLAVVAESRAIDLLRSRKSKPLHEIGFVSDAPEVFHRQAFADPRAKDPLTLLTEREEESLFKDHFFKKICPLSQKLLELRAEGLPYTEIAASLDVSIGTVKGRLRKALARLKEMIAASKERLPG